MDRSWVMSGKDYRGVPLPGMVVCTAILLSASILLCEAQTGWFHVGPNTGGFRSVQFPVDAQTGYVVGGSCFGVKTTDGGVTWYTLVFPDSTSLEEIDFPVDANMGYASGANGLILKTVDGGDSWSVLNSNIASNLYSIQFPADADTGYAVGDSGIILKTTDGGASWIKQSSGTSACLTALHFPIDAQTGYVVGTLGSILKTVDGGTQWTDLSFNLAWYEDVCFPAGPDVGYIVGYDSEIYKTADGGLTWDTIFPPSGGRYNAMHAVNFPVDDQTGYIGGTGNAIGKTTNGGATWIWQDVPMGIVRSIHFPVDADTGYAVGNYSIDIQKTIDGGGAFVEENERYDTKPVRQVVPNPFVSFSKIMGGEDGHYTVLDVTGRCVGKYEGSNIGYDLQPGVYFVRADKSDLKPIQIIKLR